MEIDFQWHLTSHADLERKMSAWDVFYNIGKVLTFLCYKTLRGMYTMCREEPLNIDSGLVYFVLVR